MSGGFFRGTSADQDTRFSNKHAKLMKSHKFPSELEQLVVDITKVKMDVMKPWIAQRATEFLGFEDEVLINFIYGLLDGKQVNGKEVQISLTGFMEKNTGKFMKELWQLLLSAQNNASGVPQQLLDAKEEETRQKQAESDMIKSEMQKKKEEGREIEEEKIKKLDGELGMKRSDYSTLELGSKHYPEASDNNEISASNGPQGRSREGHNSRGLSRSPPSRDRSISSERGRHSRSRRPISPRRKYSPPPSISPPIRRSPHLRRCSTSRSHRRLPSPVRRRMRSPLTYRSRSPNHRRSSMSKSPPSYRSRSPIRHRYPSPLHRRSPSPGRRRYRRSPSPRSSPPTRHRSLFRNRRRSPTPSRYRSRSRESLNSPSRCLSPSPVRKRSPKRQRSPVRSPREKTRDFEKYSPARQARPRGSDENSCEIREGSDSAVHRSSVSLRSPQKDTRALGNIYGKPDSSPSWPDRSHIHSQWARDSMSRSTNEDKSPYQSPVMQPKERKILFNRASPPQNPRDKGPRNDSPEPNTKRGGFDRSRDHENQKPKPSERSETSSRPDLRNDLELINKELETRSEKLTSKVLHPEDTDNGKVTAVYKKTQKVDEKIRPYSGEKHKKTLSEMDKPTLKTDGKYGSGSLSSGSDDSYERRRHRKHRRSRRKEVTSDDSSDSEIEDKREAKRRKKEKKRERKEERRLRREERHRRREERRAEKLKEKLNYGNAAKETVSEQQILEIKLREKALESLRAKKGVGH